MGDLIESIENSKCEAGEFLSGLIGISSKSGEESGAALWLEKKFDDLGFETKRITLSDDIKDDPLYCRAGGNVEYDGRFNLAINVRGTGNSRVAVNTHIDTVPIGQNPKTAELRGGLVYGRGACDAKGQIAAIFQLLSALKHSGQTLKRSLTIHLVVEEEVGGNGSLGLRIKPGEFDAALVLEPTSLRVLTAARGAVWFDITVSGVSGHSGSASGVSNAILDAMQVVEKLKTYHAGLLHRLKGNPPFESFPNPMPLTIGMFNAGDWPATVPSKANIKGVCGFLPGMTAEAVKQEITGLLSPGHQQGEPIVDFIFSRDAFVTPRDSELLRLMGSAYARTGAAMELGAFPACCDGWFYASRGIPTLIMGAGNLEQAHSDNEYVALDQIDSLAQILGAFLMQ